MLCNIFTWKVCLMLDEQISVRSSVFAAFEATALWDPFSFFDQEIRIYL